MSDPFYNCDGCRTTTGRAGCPTHRDNALYVDPSHSWSSSTPVLTHCNHGLDLRINPRCYLCHPVAAPPPLDRLREAAQFVVAAINGSHDTMASHDHSKCLGFALDMLRAALRDEGETK